MLTATHIRAARAVLGWGVRDLAAQAGVSINAVTRLEAGRDVRKSTADKIQATLEAAGVAFETSDRPGIRWRQAAGKPED